MNREVLHIVIPGLLPPAPRPRARVIDGKHLRRAIAQIYTPRTGDYANWKKRAAALMQKARSELGNREEWPIRNAAIEVEIFVVVPLPIASERKTIHVVRDWCRSLRRGDADNLAKGPLDAASGVLWNDDSDVARLTLEKVIGEQGEPERVEIMIQRLVRQGATVTGFEQRRAAFLELGVLNGSVKERKPWIAQRETSLPFRL